MLFLMKRNKAMAWHGRTMTPLMFGSKAFLLKPECSSALTVNIEKLTTASARPSMYTPLRRRFCFLHTIIHTNKSSFVFDSLLLVEATL